MKSNSIKAVLLASTLIGGLGVAAPAMAQDEEPAVAEDAETIVITGSRIERSSFNMTQPVSVVDGADLELRGFTNAADAIYDIPGVVSVGAVQTANFSGGIGIGQNLSSLYGLGSQRTLTLVNGRRFVSSNPPSSAGPGAGGSQVDLNNIPTALIERVDVVKVGGAAVYGADAVAGVINFVLRDDYEGLEVAADYTSVGEDGFADESSMRILLGGNFDNNRGNVVMSIEYNQTSAIRESDVCALGGECDYSFFDPVASSGLDGLQLFNQPRAGILSFGGLATPGSVAITNIGVGAFASGRFLQFDDAGSLVPYDPGVPTGNLVWSAGGDGLNLGPIETVREPIERWNFSTFATYDILPNLRFNAEVFANSFHSRYDFQQPYYSSGLFGGTSGALQFDVTDPRLSPQARAELQSEGITTFYLQKGFTEFNQVEQNETDLLLVNLGLEGEFDALGREFTWELYWQEGETKITEISDDRSEDRFFAALDVGINPATGEVDCRFNYDPTYTAPLAGGNGVQDDRGVLGSVGDCVPYNPFALNSQAALDYIQVSKMNFGSIRQEVIAGYIATDLVELPAGTAQIAAGFELRDEEGEYIAGAANELDIVAGGGGGATGGGYSTTDFYVELLAPAISSDMNIPFVETLDFEASYRSMDNTRSGRDEAYAVGMAWGVTSAVTLRANSSRTVRAPSIRELFSPILPSGAFVDDPCDDPSVTAGPNPAVREANCRAGGGGLPPIPAGFVSQAQNASVQGLSGGNPNLNVETSNSYNVGIVYQPTWFEGFSLAVDYINFDIEDAITAFTPTNLMEACYDSTDFPNNSFCTAFVRLPNGQLPSLNAFVSGQVNAAVRQLDAVEVTARYRGDVNDLPFFNTFESDLGSFDIDGRFYNVQTDSFAPTGTTFDDDVGDDDNPTWRGDVRARWFRGPVVAFIDMEWLGSALINNQQPRDDFYKDENGNPIYNVEGAFVFDIGGSYDINDRVTLRGSVENVFDWQPDPAQTALAFGNIDWYFGPTYNVGITARF